MCMWYWWKAEGGQRGGDGVYGCHKWWRQGEQVQQKIIQDANTCFVEQQSFMALF